MAIRRRNSSGRIRPAERLQIYLDYIDILHRVKQRGRPRDAAPSAAANELVLLRAKMVRVLHAVPALVTGSSVTIEARYASSEDRRATGLGIGRAARIGRGGPGCEGRAERRKVHDTCPPMLCPLCLLPRATHCTDTVADAGHRLCSNHSVAAEEMASTTASQLALINAHFVRDPPHPRPAALFLTPPLYFSFPPHPAPPPSFPPLPSPRPTDLRPISALQNKSQDAGAHSEAPILASLPLPAAQRLRHVDTLATAYLATATAAL